MLQAALTSAEHLLAHLILFWVFVTHLPGLQCFEQKFLATFSFTGSITSIFTLSANDAVNKKTENSAVNR